MALLSFHIFSFDRKVSHTAGGSCGWLVERYPHFDADDGLALRHTTTHILLIDAAAASSFLFMIGAFMEKIDQSWRYIEIICLNFPAFILNEFMGSRLAKHTQKEDIQEDHDTILPAFIEIGPGVTFTD